MKTVNAKFRYKDYDIYTKNGKYTVGCEDNTSFEDCTLENFGYVDEYDAVKWLREKGYGVKFISYDDGSYVPYETYLENLMLYQISAPEEDLRPDIIIAPQMHLSSIKEAKEFIDWVVENEKHVDFRDIAEDIVRELRNCRIDDITSGSPYYYIKEIEGTDGRAVCANIFSDENDGHLYYAVYCSYEEPYEGVWKYTERLSIDELVKVIEEFYYSDVVLEENVKERNQVRIMTNAKQVINQLMEMFEDSMDVTSVVELGSAYVSSDDGLVVTLEDGTEIILTVQVIK